MQGKHVPKRYSSARQTWPQINSEFKFTLWDEVDLAALAKNTEWETIIEKCETLIQRADVYRCAILEKYGGIYADMDMHAIKPLEPLRKECEETDKDIFIGYTSFQNTPLHWILANNNALIMAKPASPIWPRIRQEFLKRLHTKTLSDFFSPVFTVIKTTGPGVWTHLANTCPEIKSLPKEYFYSLNVVKGADTLTQADIDTLKPFSYCYHTQAATWVDSWESIILSCFVGNRWKITVFVLILVIVLRYKIV
jgi:mannosyltransferase OCH1-like enzyme